MRIKINTYKTADETPKVYSLESVRGYFRAVARRRRQILEGAGISLLIIAAIASFITIAAYYHYATLLDTYLAGNSLQVPAGIYAAPRRVSVGQHVTRDEVIERLRRAGYVEGDAGGGFAAGSFTVLPDGVEARTAEFARGPLLPATLRISFNKDGVARIENGETRRALDAIQLPAEMLSADGNTKWQTRRATTFDQLPPVLVRAVCAIEDRNFFEHDGVDFLAIVRAFYNNLREGGIREGGSTITQQFIKNQFLTPERTYSRKFAEALMAIALEQRLTKEQIFALYCDRVYLGHSGLTSVYGFNQGARVFLGKGLGDLTLGEAAFLAGLVKAPNRYSPHNNLEDALARRDVVLGAMADAGYIKPEEAEAAGAQQLALLPPQRHDQAAAPHFVDFVRRELEGRGIDESWAHYQVETTLDLDLQQAANEAVAEQLARLDKLFARRKDGARPEVALVALDPRTGAVLAMVGGRDYAASQLNRAADARRQPGSVFKPIVYAAAMTRGVSPMTTYMNAPREITFGYKAVYKPQNFGHSYTNRPVMLREAIIRSLNVVAVDAALQAGLGHVADLAARLGLPRPDLYPSMALGAFEATPLELAGAYTTFAADGMRADPLAIRAIKAHGQVVTGREAARRGVLSPAVAYLVTDTLSDAVNRGTAARLRALGYRGPAAGKTGTSRDAWFVGYTPNLLCAVWVGFDDNRDLGLTGGEAAVPVWAAFVKRALLLRPDLAAESFAKPAGVVSIEVDPETGLLAGEYCPQRQFLMTTAYLEPGVCYEHQFPSTTFDESQFLAETSLEPAEEEAPLLLTPIPEEALESEPPEPEDPEENRQEPRSYAPRSEAIPDRRPSGPRTAPKLRRGDR